MAAVTQVRILVTAVTQNFIFFFFKFPVRNRGYCLVTELPLGCQLLSELSVTASNCKSNLTSVGGIVVSIAAFQAVDPGSIPGRRIVFFFFPRISSK